MASLDTLSDAEIRAKLFDLGCEVGPVTPTTRRVYVKKLQSLIENGSSSKKSANVQEQQPAPSPEESLFKNRRKSQGTSKPSGKTIAKPWDTQPLASSTILDHSIVQPNIAKSTLFNDIRPTHIPARDSTPPERRVSSSTNLQPNSDEAAAFRSPYNYNNLPSFTGSKYNSPTYLGSASRFDPDQPYASEFTRRLSNSSRVSAQGASPRSPYNSKTYDSVKESDDEDDSSGPVYSKFGPSSRGPINQRDNGQAFQQQGGWFGRDASVYILGFLALFFLIVAFAYFHLHTSDSSVSPYVSELSYPRCNGAEEYCVPDDKIKKATAVFKLLAAELVELASRAGCTHGNSPKISSEEASRIVNMKDSSLSAFDLDNYIYFAGILAKSNPSQNVIFTPSDGFKLREVPSSVLCSFLNHAMSLTYWLVRIVLALVVMITIYCGFKWWVMTRTKHREEVLKLFSQIIDLVSLSAVQNGPGYAVKSHTMDRLISAQDKASKMKLWEEASALVDMDSRVRTEVQQVEGEDFSVWRWLAPPPNPKRKVWQGQAFEMMDGSVNSVPESPTSCLKIRHMFDPSQEEGENWVQAVADAVLEKCRDAVIYHIVVEKQSPEGCVYVKCASPRDAGIAYRALHGFWYDTKLITVKYIREARYLERFPDSIRAKSPLVSLSRRQH